MEAAVEAEEKVEEVVEEESPLWVAVCMQVRKVNRPVVVVGYTEPMSLLYRTLCSFLYRTEDGESNPLNVGSDFSPLENSTTTATMSFSVPTDLPQFFFRSNIF